MKKTTIFRQLVYNVIIPSLIALLILGAINYQHTRKLMIESNKDKNDIIADEIKRILEFQDMSLNILEGNISNQMQELSQKIVDQYKRTPKLLETADLRKLQIKLGMDTTMEDIYIINRNGQIINTTFSNDLGLNLFSFGEKHERYLKEVFEKKTFTNERFTIEATTKRLKKYTYQPLPGGEYLIEIGFYSKEADQIVNFIRNTLKNLTQKQSNLKSVDLFIYTDKAFSLNDQSILKDEHKAILDEVFDTKKTRTILEKNGNSRIEFNYIYMDRQKSDLYKGSAIRIILDRTEEFRMLRLELMKLFFIFGLTILVVVFLIYRKTMVITSPIKKLVDRINRITNGHLHERAEVVGNNEIATLSLQFNRMIEELESYYNELEQKVRDRTAEIEHQKEEIESQRDAIEEQRDMLMITNSNLEIAYHQISDQKKHIMDSIMYAKRIQTAILPPEDYIKRVLPESFILYQPKDIVSGDFYWLTDVDDLIMIAAVDCTGHGVPGAFMSIVGFNNLNYSVNMKGKRMPGEVLTELNVNVNESLQQHRTQSELKDGMDIALCCIDYKKQTLYYSGANNPLLFISNNEYKLYEPTKAPIGAFVDDTRAFVTTEIPFKSGDQFYIFSDGYADQFGGPDNKKFLKRNLYKQLLENCEEPMDKQKQHLDHLHYIWKGEHEQIDDILVIGVRL